MEVKVIIDEINGSYKFNIKQIADLINVLPKDLENYYSNQFIYSSKSGESLLKKLNLLKFLVKELNKLVKEEFLFVYKSSQSKNTLEYPPFKTSCMWEIITNYNNITENELLEIANDALCEYRRVNG